MFVYRACCWLYLDTVITLITKFGILDQTECYILPIIVRRIVYSKGGQSIRNKVNLLMKLVSLNMNREEGPAPGSTWRFLIFGRAPSNSAMARYCYFQWFLIRPCCGLVSPICYLLRWLITNQMVGM